MGEENTASAPPARARIKEFPALHDTGRLVDVRSRFARCELVLDMLHEAGDDPLLLLWRIAQDASVDVGRRIDCAKEVASYLHSKTSNVKVQGDKDAPIRLSVSWDTDTAQPAIEASHKPVIVINEAEDDEV